MSGIHPLWLIAAAVGLGAIPIILGVITSYLKVSIVLGMLRNALGIQQVPGNMVVMALSIAITFFIMGPVFERSIAEFDGPAFTNQLRNPPSHRFAELIAPILKPWKEFMMQHAGEREVALFHELSEVRGVHSQASSTNDSLRIVAPAFVVSELKRAFTMAFMLLLPFLMLDLIVANILAGMGMQMMSPVMVSLPLKILLFVASDGWLLVTKALVHSYS